MSDEKHQLPVLENGDEPELSCSPKIYVSNEEASILAAMRDLRERSIELRSKLEASGSSEKSSEIEKQLEQMRVQRQHLVQQREDAYRRKMIMLGHLPPDEETSLF